MSWTIWRATREKPRHLSLNDADSLFYLTFYIAFSSLLNINSFSHSMAPSSCKGIKRVTADEPLNSDMGDWTWTTIDINAGEDIKGKIISFAEDHEMITADGHGFVSSPTIGFGSVEPVTYEGQFSISILRGTYLSDPNGPPTGDLFVELVGADGQTIHGYVEGSLMAATAVQVVVFIFEYNW